MKILWLTFLAFCFAAISMQAQNWAAFHSGRTSHYQSDTATIPDQSIHTDSLAVIGADTILSVARRFVCCIDTPLRNQPQFTGREITLRPDGTFLFHNPGKISLPTKASVGASFVLDSISGMTAQVTRVYQDLLLGSVLDSIKVFTTQSGDSLLLSKNHGILEWPGSLGRGHFLLAGIQQGGLGDTFPGFDGIIGYKAGDVYYYESEVLIFDIVSEQAFFQVKMVVDSTQDRQNGLMVYFSGITRKTVYTNTFYSYTEIRTTIDSSMIAKRPNGLLAKGHSEEVAISMLLADFLIGPAPTYISSPAVYGLWLSNADEYWSHTLYVNGANGMEMHVGTRANATFGSLYEDIGGDSCLRVFDEFEAVFTEGLGITHVGWMRFEEIGTFDLVGSIIDGDTLGTIFPDSVLLAKEDGYANFGLALSPNPASNWLKLSWNGITNAEVIIFDLQGKIMQREDVFGAEAMLDLNQLSDGVYLLQWRTEQGIVTKRLMVAH